MYCITLYLNCQLHTIELEKWQVVTMVNQTCGILKITVVKNWHCGCGVQMGAVLTGTGAV